MQYEKSQSPKSSTQRMTPAIDEKNRISSFLTKRSKILSEKINLVNKSNSTNFKDNMIKR